MLPGISGTAQEYFGVEAEDGSSTVQSRAWLPCIKSRIVPRYSTPNGLDYMSIQRPQRCPDRKKCCNGLMQK